MRSRLTNAPPAPISVRQFYEGGSRYDGCELWNGGLLVHEPAGGFPGAVAFRVMARLARHVEGGSRPWLFTAETGFVLSEDPPRVLAPDGACVLRERLATLPLRGFVPCVPNFVLEVRSGRDTFHEGNAKAGLWISHGADVVWAVDPDTRTVVVHRGPSDVAEARGADGVDAAPAFPAFRLSVDEIFAGL
jgi:Uma2 family endonuclease